jgi:hypothetical protein
MAHAEQKYRLFAWLVLHGRIVISDNLALKRWQHDLICKLCGLQRETVQHLLLDCTFTVAVCEKFFEWKGLLGLVPPHLGTWRHQRLVVHDDRGYSQGEKVPLSTPCGKLGRRGTGACFQTLL